MRTVIIISGGIAIIVNIWSIIKIYAFLKEKNEKLPHFVFINFFFFRYLRSYKEITTKENGKTGYLYYLWLFTINCILLCALLLLLPALIT
jgi:uncharacterized membrane protein YozB (DUF420 family)